MLKAAADAEVRGWKMSQEKNDWYKKALTEKGMKIMPPSAKLMSDMKQVGGIMLADWEKKAGADGAAAARRLPQAIVTPALRRPPARPPARRATAGAQRSTASTTRAAALAALFMVGLLAMVLLSVDRAPVRTSTSPAPTPTPAT